MLLLRIFLLSLLQMAFVSAAHADENGPCGKDGPKFCESAKFGKGKMFECLVSNKSRVSTICREHLNRLLSYRDDCKSEIGMMCGADKPFYCLLNPSMAESVFKNGSPACLAAIYVRAAYMLRCQPEISTNCSESSSSLPALLSCLKATKVSPACKDELVD